ncbi:MAG TPA: triose-phosphate isomerase [Alphaproteobacteria bacterium]|nr:triose-phosphate isomerase [Alphaproteobacteria bacterium]
MPKRRRLIVGNWKMYGRLTSGLQLARELADKAVAARPLDFDMVLCPPATLVWPIAEVLMGTPVMLGAQDCHTATHGPYTGDLSAAMFADLECRYVIVGHSERRIGHGETDELVAKKAAAVQAAGLTAILCVGETAEQAAEGGASVAVERQLRASLPDKCTMAHLVVAYEPVWAIGSGQQPAVEDIASAHQAIRRALGNAGEAVRVIYGGSVTPHNAGPILAEEQVDGVLVGSASINADGFWAIAEKAR